MKYTTQTLLGVLLMLWSVSVWGQISDGGVPIGLTVDEAKVAHYKTSKIDVDELNREDALAKDSGEPYRMAVYVPVNRDLMVDGVRTRLADGGSVWHMVIEVPGAQGMGLCYDQFWLPEGAKMFVYTPDMNTVQGAFTSKNNRMSGLFAQALLPGDVAVLECYVPAKRQLPQVYVSDVAFAYRGLDNMKGFGRSGACEVDVNCSEGDAWKHQRDGVVRLQCRIGNAAFWCSGSVVRTTSDTLYPYLLTADHCANYHGNYSTQDDREQWVFYFNYQFKTCGGNGVEPEAQSMVGCDLLSSSGVTGVMGSDFYLIKLKSAIPDAYMVYYQGWDRSGAGGSNGVSIHHPQGDVKKISTYHNALEITGYPSVNGPLDTHFKVYWEATENGHGVTEGGSSGSPIFNTQGLIVGTLTGGYASCSNPGAPDYYGRFSRSWKWGDADESQLAPWLDSKNSGVQWIDGVYPDFDGVLARFSADTTLSVGASTGFKNLSINDPRQYQWFFPGGIPSRSNVWEPVVRYDKAGTYDVKLIVYNEHSSDTLLRKSYIRVKPALYPNPVNGEMVTVFFGREDDHTVSIDMMDLTGRLVHRFNEDRIGKEYVNLDVSTVSSGVYILYINSGFGAWQEVMIKN